ncbi:hypothetical protein M0804_002035 [Polistes exclamans]|nr:hypothetical protein M0804_002035 [Polistes exclamans]
MKGTLLKVTTLLETLRTYLWEALKIFNHYYHHHHHHHHIVMLHIKTNMNEGRQPRSLRSFARGVEALLKGQLALCIVQAGAAAAAAA